MNALAEIKLRFSQPLGELVEDPQELLGMIRPAGDPKFGDYQANCAMSLGNRLGKPPREVAADLVEKVVIGDLCKTVEIAGPGFINLTLDDQWLKGQLENAFRDKRLGVESTQDPRRVVVDYSSPNVAKPMHVGHVRSTVIGAALANILRFVGNEVITDNHLGDWGTQFGMIIYGYKHFVDEAAYKSAPVTELGRLYKKVRSLIDFRAATRDLPVADDQLSVLQDHLDQLKQQTLTGDKKKDKQAQKQVVALENKLADQKAVIEQLRSKIESVTRDAEQQKIAAEHAEIEQAVLHETAALHEGDPTNRRLWDEFLPFCREDIQQIYRRLGIEFDNELGESFYHDQLGSVVEAFEAKGFARESDGAICVFMEGYDTPMIIQKKDGAFLYATTDLATIKYRMEQWHADAILYVVDHRQHQHFEKLFDAARLWGYDGAELTHVSFGTVLGDDGKPFKTRSGDTVGLSGLLDEAESRALLIATEQNPGLPESEQEKISQVIGIGALKYADLSQNRASDYKFSYEKMLALKGNTATYLQYSYARVQGIIRKLEIDIDALRRDSVPFEFATDIERQLAVKLIRFGEALDEVLLEYKPNLLCNYLFELTQKFFQFYDQCSVKDAGSETLKKSRLQLCDLTARTIEQGLSLLGIGVLDQM